MRTILALLLVSAVGALAESSDPFAVALGSMTEEADAVLVVRAGSEASLGDGLTVATGFRVEEVLRGAVAVPEVSVLRPADDPAWEAGVRYLAFLRRGDGERWIPLHRELGLRRLVDGEAGIPLREVVREYASTLDPAGTVAQPDRLRAMLVQWMCDGHSGVSWSAANDFVRHGELHPGLTPDQGAAIVEAYAREPVGKGVKKALALAVAVTGDPAAGQVLVNSLLLPRAREIRPTVVEALRRLGDERIPDRIALALTDADEEQRVSLLTALGQLDAAAAASSGRRYLADPSPRVRTVAAQALGLGARTMRRADPDAEPEGRRELEILLRDARSENEIKAALWALAQLDQPEAWAVVRKAAVEDEREFARRYASRYLKFPRQRLILEPD